MRCLIQTHSGYKSDEFPLWFEVDGIRFEIITIEDRWYDVSYEVFRVFANNCGGRGGSVETSE